MYKVALSAIGALLVFSASVSWAADPMSEKEASPTLKERITKDTVKGTLMKTEGEYYWIKDTDGKEVKVHVDSSTKMDKVIKGDRVKAYITDQGHVTTLQRLEK
jgi:hypothetical protein